MEDKIVVINHEYCLKEAILWPLSIALFYILILPYINLLFDYALSFSNNKKDERKKNVTLSNLQHKKAEAKYEREIAEERAGTSEISELKDQIERLNTENKQLTGQNSENFERHNKTMEIAKSIENNQIEEIKNLKIELDNVQNEYSKFIKKNSDQYKSVVNSMSSIQIDNFKKYGDFISKKSGSVTIDQIYLDLYVQLGLLRLKVDEKSKSHTFTTLGKIAYNNLKLIPR